MHHPFLHLLIIALIQVINPFNHLLIKVKGKKKEKRIRFAKMKNNKKKGTLLLKLQNDIFIQVKIRYSDLNKVKYIYSTIDNQ